MAQTYSFKKLSEPRELGEGPHWDHETNQLFYVDCFVGDIHKLNPTTGVNEKLSLGRLVTIVIPVEDEKESFLISSGKKLSKLNWETKAVKDLAACEEEKTNTRFNDGKCDRQGRVWIGTMGEEKIPGVVEPDLGSLYSMDKSCQVKRITDKVSLSNGLAWSLDNQKMFYIDSAKRHVYVFDHDAQAGTVDNRQVLFDYHTKEGCKEEELPDGMTIDVDGKLWVACYNGGRVLRIDPETAKIIKTVDLPPTKTTSVAFGGADLSTLFVTSAYKGLSEDQRKAQPEGGCLFGVNFTKENIKGLAADKFRAA